MQIPSNSFCFSGFGFSTEENIDEAVKEALALTENVQCPDIIFVQMTTGYLKQVRQRNTNILDVIRSFREDITDECALYGMGATSIGCCSSNGDIVSAATDCKEGVVDGCSISDRLFAVGFVSFSKTAYIQEFSLKSSRSKSRSAKADKKEDLVFLGPVAKTQTIPEDVSYDCMIISGRDICAEIIRKKFKDTAVSGGFLMEDELSPSATCVGKKVVSNMSTGGVALKLPQNIVVENLIIRGQVHSVCGHYESREEVASMMQEAYEEYMDSCEERMSNGFKTKPVFALSQNCRGRLPGYKAEIYQAAYGDMERFSSLFPGVPVLTHYSGGEKLPDSAKPEILSCVFNVFCEVSPIDVPAS